LLFAVAVLVLTSVVSTGSLAQPTDSSQVGQCGPISDQVTTVEGVIALLATGDAGGPITFFSASSATVDDTESNWSRAIAGAVGVVAEDVTFAVYGDRRDDADFVVRATRYPGACDRALALALADRMDGVYREPAIPYAVRRLGSVEAVRFAQAELPTASYGAALGDVAILVTGEPAIAETYLASLVLPDPSAGPPPVAPAREPPAIGQPGWRPLDEMPLVRRGSAVATLADGSVLMIGGYDDYGAVADVQRIDPTSGAWEILPAMRTSRADAAAIDLEDGRVLVVGGRSADGTVLASSELFDPDRGGWEPAAFLSTARSDLSLTRLANGDLLAIGGTGYDGPVRSIERFMASDGYWSEVDSVTHARSDPVVIRRGNVVAIAGGFDVENGTSAAGIEEFDSDGNYAYEVSSIGAPIDGTPVWLESGLIWIGCTGASSTNAYWYVAGSDSWGEPAGAPCRRGPTFAVGPDQVLYTGLDPFGLGACVFDVGTRACEPTDPAWAQHQSGLAATTMVDGREAFLLTGGRVRDSWSGATEVLQLP
jgi:hypothetical protein